MNFDEAIRAHSAWKLRLKTYISKPDGSLKVAQTEVDNQCDLGKWIYGEGKAFADMAEYKTLLAEHAKFHRAAADVIRRADSGANVSEDVALGSSSEFSKASASVVQAIMAMRTKAGAAA